MYERDSFLCGFLGCIPFEQTVVSLPLRVESGHTYIPVARKHCQKDWVWVVDRGATAESDLNNWRQNRASLVLNLRAKDLLGLRVVAGAAPPERCDSQLAEKIENIKSVEQSYKLRGFIESARKREGTHWTLKVEDVAPFLDKEEDPHTQGTDRE